MSSVNVETRRQLFVAAVTRLYPDINELESLDTSGSLEDFWFKVCRVTHQRPEKLAGQLAPLINLTFLSDVQPDKGADQFISAHLANQEGVLPIRLEQDTLIIGVCLPVDDDLMQKIKFAINRPVKFVLILPSDLVYASQYTYSQIGGPINTHGTIDLDQPPSDQQSALIKLAYHLLINCIEENASDLHVHAFLGGGVARARIDGMLRRIALLPEKVYISLCRYFKVNGSMDPTNERIPQDGRATLKYRQKSIELRLSSLPAKGGERIVIRFLDQSRRFSLENSGFAVKEIQALRRLSRNTSGLFLITGPTGSGKTSTLYALLSELNSVHNNIITVEDPVEYQLPGISQVHINEKAGLTFDGALRSALRQDPDILLIGEIRDRETAQIALQGALTGHLVLSTLHTNDALSTIPRLLDLGIDRSVLIDALRGVSAQRLCRKLCSNCKVETTQKALYAEEAAFQQITKIIPPYRPVGCEQCGHTGYKGRLPVLEIIEMNEQLRRHIMDDSLAMDYASSVDHNDLSSMALSVAKHIISGETTVSEALRVLGQGLWQKLMIHYHSTLFDIPAISEDEFQKDAPGVIFVSRKPVNTDRLRELLESESFDFYTVANPDEANEILRRNSNIIFVIVHYDSGLSDDEICQYVAEGRKKLAWSRLLALLLLPPGHTGLPAKLQEQGATSQCLFTPVSPERIVEEVKGALTYLNAKEPVINITQHDTE